MLLQSTIGFFVHLYTFIHGYSPELKKVIEPCLLPASLKLYHNLFLFSYNKTSRE